MTIGELITVIIPVYNEEINLPPCLDLLKDIPHKIVVDSGSTDRTVEIAQAAGCKVMKFEWNGHFPKKRNWAMFNHQFETPWVMFLDADERVTQAFKDELVRVLPTTTHDCFRVCLNNWFMGKILKHGDPMRKTALLRVGKGAYEKIDEDAWSNLPMEMHEHIKVDGTTGDIVARLEHHDKRTLSNYYSKHCDYADWEAHRFMAINDWSILTRREKIKYRLMRWKLFPLAYWFASYILKGGFLDGTSGWYFSLNKFSYFTQMQAKILELEMREKGEHSHL